MTSLIDSFAPWLLDYYLLTTALLALALATIGFLKQPAQRLAVARSTIIALMLLAALCTLPDWSLIHLLAAPSAQQPPPLSSHDAPAERLTSTKYSTLVASPATAHDDSPIEVSSPELSQIAAPNDNGPHLSWPASLALAHALGAACVFAWLALGLLAAHRLRRHSLPAPPELITLLNDIASAHNNSRQQVQLQTSTHIHVPVALGIRRPCILLPESWIHQTPLPYREGLGEGSITERYGEGSLHVRAVLAHELAHIRNHDLHWLAAGRGLLLILWAQPLYWLLRRSMRLDQEVLADSAAAELTSRQRYAEQLVTWVRGVGIRPDVRLSSAVGLWEGPSQLRRRIALLIDERLVLLRECPRGWRRGAAGAAILSSLLLSIVTLSPGSRLVAGQADDIESRSDAQHSTPAAPRFAKRHVPIEGNFAEGWKQTVALLESDFGAGGQVKLSVERGWLCARRESSDGRLEWQFVLCRIDNSTLPEIEVMANMPSFIDISYRDRRYFIRESTNILRAMREVAPASPLLAKDSLLSLGAKRSGWGKSPDWVGITCSAWVDADWFFVATGPDEQSWRSVVRLDPMEMPGGHGVRTTVEGHIRYFHGDKWLIDDGELLLADRTTLPMHESMKKQTAAREAILAGKLPAIDATAWLNTDDPSTWDTLKGKVVLLDFWGTWCGPCVAKLPDIQKLHEKYSDRGLVVLAVHSQQGADACAAFVKEQGYAFPVALDSGKTAEAYSISSWPTYFLVDRAGNVVQGFVNEPPSAAAIEALLGGANSQKGREDPQSSQEVARAAPPVRLVQATQRVTVNRNRPPALLAYGDGKADGKKSYGGSGHLIRFELPEGVTKVRGIRIHSSRYGYPQAPDENAEITFLSDDRGETLHSEATPYHLFKRGKESWVRVMFDKEVELPEKFWVALNFNAQQTKGVYVSYDTSTKGEYSRVGLPGDEEEPKKTDFNGDWMVQLMLTRPK